LCITVAVMTRIMTMMAAAACGPSVASFPRVGGLAGGAGEKYCTVAAVDVRCGLAAVADGPNAGSFPRVGGPTEWAEEWYCPVAAVDVRCGLAAASSTRVGTGASLALDGRPLFVRFSPALPCDSPRAFCSAAFAAHAREI